MKRTRLALGLVMLASVGAAAIRAAGHGNADATAGMAGTIVSTLPAPPWVAVSRTGIAVAVVPESLPLLVGSASLSITVGHAAPAASPLTIDLVSPTMPMHGITRYEAIREAEGSYRVELDFPMEGIWSLYVNVGSDADHAVVDVLVEPRSSNSPTTTE